MKARLLHKAGKIAKGATIAIGARVGANDKRGPDDTGGASTMSAPVYSVTDEDGHAENVDTRDLEILP